MKKVLIIFSLVFGLMFWSNNTFAQAAPPANHGASGDQAPGGGAPIGGGLFILLGLGAAYGGKKLYDQRKSSPEE